MSLSNPNAYVTEERLNEYHNTILPYLGGMPDILANKFARGDMYSTDEKMIGQWIDGKPLYQKVVKCGQQSASATKVVVPHNIENVDFIRIVGAWAAESGPNFISGGTEIIPNVNGSSDFMGRVTADATNISIKQQGGWDRYYALVVVQYTKTTDSPIAIGIDTDYSTTEKIVGTWVDGKPLYQKTISGLSASIPKLDWANSVANVNELNIKYLIDTKILRAGGTGLMVYIPEEVTIEDGYIAVYGNNSTRTISTIIIQYTKTTD